MKRNFFGEPILQPGDDIGAAFAEKFETEDEDVLTARFLEHDEEFGWTCTISDGDGNEIAVHDFDSEAELREWLREQDVDID